MFCRKDFNEHQQQLSTQLDIIVREHDSVKQSIHQTCDAITLKVFDEIEKWETEWMKKVKMAADRAREEVLDIVSEPKKQLKRITDEIRPRMEEEDYVEYDLDRWMNEIKQVNADMKAMTSTTVIESGDECEWKEMIKGNGPVVEKWDMSGEWKMMRRWRPPVLCQQNEEIADIRFSCDGSYIGVTVCVKDQYNLFHVRDRSMKTLNNITFPWLEYGYRLLSLPNGQWLTHEPEKKELHMINKDGKLEQTFTYPKSVNRTTLIGQSCLIIRTHDSELCFHDL
ncbi:unnamed protein product [Didymodactylos carnosus]|uniref:Uncharacterized protein n=1 Tax=Didymodactylos carnosus TaxID=1234261 RepID=A0A8S2DMN8_9BILA|nr:unnamed protein product [Didymodactylos carnosus]CAF3778250.1 unnamed protein product [Didymodactylos carnosus]